MSPSRVKRRKKQTVFCLSIKIDRHWLKVSWVPPIGYISHSCTRRREITSRQAMATFWRKFHHDGKFIPAWWGWGVQALPFHSFKHHKQSWGLHFSLEARYTSPVSPISFSSLWFYTVPQFHWTARLLSNSLQEQYHKYNFFEPASYEPCQSTFTSIFVCFQLGQIKGTVQRELRWVKIGINRTAMQICIAASVIYHAPRDTITRGA